MRNWLRTVLFLSAFSPALLTMAYVRYDIYGWSVEVLQLAIIGALGGVIPLLIVRLAADQGERFRLQAKKLESNDFLLLAFISSYFLPIVLRAAEVSIIAISLTLVVIGIVLWLISSMPAHPVLRIMRFRFYKLETSNGMVYTLISRREIQDPRDVRAVIRISPTMLMEDSSGV